MSQHRAFDPIRTLSAFCLESADMCGAIRMSAKGQRRTSPGITQHDLMSALFSEANTVPRDTIVGLGQTALAARGENSLKCRLTRFDRYDRLRSRIFNCAWRRVGRCDGLSGVFADAHYERSGLYRSSIAGQ